VNSSGDWVAASTRAVGLVGRRLGTNGALELASSPSTQAAMRLLAASSYRRAIETAPSGPAAGRAVDNVALWHLRVLNGWAPGVGTAVLKVLAGRFEIENLVDRFRRFRGAETEAPFVLGSLATTWRQAAAAGGPAEVRRILQRSAWGDPGGDEPAAVRLGLDLAWARRLSRVAPEHSSWAPSFSALTFAKAVASGGAATLAESPREDAALLLGEAALHAGSLGELRERVPPRARFVLEAAGEDGALWRAETAWWRRVDLEALALVLGPLPGPTSVLAAGMALLCDARRVRGALELAALGGRTPGEATDVVA